MITEFDKNGAIALNKRRFGECLAEADYEGALDCLIKYSEAKDNPDFHLACGMLYLLMTQDSDDNELFALAFREFLMHITRNPNCKEAYRNLLATVFLRHEPMSMVEVGVWIKACGMDTTDFLEELTEVGINMFMGSGDLVDDIENLFLPGEFGEIDPDYGKLPSRDEPNEQAATESQELNEKKSKVIRFRNGTQITAQEQPHAPDEKHHVTHEFEGSAESTEETDIVDALELFAKLTDGDEWDDEQDEAEYDGLQNADLKAHLILRSAEQHARAHKYDKALDELNSIKANGGNIRYYVECMRAHIYLECDMAEEATLSLARATDIKPDGAFAGTLLCKLYEMTDKTVKISDTLKKIELTDFMDADHVYKAARFAIKYCDTDDALDLLEDYIEEYNVMDIRLLYAQVLYNSGERELAIRELYALNRIFYDDFNVWFYYLSARAGVKELPVDEEVPQHVIATLVDGFIELVLADAVTKDVLQMDEFKYGMEMFLSLEFDNTREIVVPMFDALHRLTANPLLTQRMNDVLVSPYAEPLVKAAVLADLMTQGQTAYTLEVVFCPINEKMSPALDGEYSDGYKIAYAYIVTLCRWLVEKYVKLAAAFKPHTDGAGYDERDIANYMLRTVKKACKQSKNLADGRISYALGYKTKTDAAKAYKRMAAVLDDKIPDIKEIK